MVSVELRRDHVGYALYIDDLRVTGRKLTVSNWIVATWRLERSDLADALTEKPASHPKLAGHSSHTWVRDGVLCDRCCIEACSYRATCPCPCTCNPLAQTGGGHAGDCPCFEPECTCYELTGGHQPGCAFNRKGGGAYVTNQAAADNYADDMRRLCRVAIEAIRLASYSPGPCSECAIFGLVPLREALTNAFGPGYQGLPHAADVDPPGLNYFTAAMALARKADTK